MLYPAHVCTKVLKRWIWRKKINKNKSYRNWVVREMHAVTNLKCFSPLVLFQIERRGNTKLQQVNTLIVRKHFELSSIVEKSTSGTGDWKLRPNNLINSRFSTSYCHPTKNPIFLENTFQPNASYCTQKVTGWNPTGYNSQGVRADLIAYFGFKVSVYMYSWFSVVQRHFSSSTINAQH